MGQWRSVDVFKSLDSITRAKKKKKKSVGMCVRALCLYVRMLAAGHKKSAQRRVSNPAFSSLSLSKHLRKGHFYTQHTHTDTHWPSNRQQRIPVQPRTQQNYRLGSLFVSHGAIDIYLNNEINWKNWTVSALSGVRPLSNVPLSFSFRTFWGYFYISAVCWLIRFNQIWYYHL